MRARAAALAVLVLAGATSGATACAPSTVAAGRSREAASGLAHAESLYADLREAADRLDVTDARGARATDDGVPVDALRELVRTRLAATRVSLARLDGRDERALSPDDRRALVTMRAVASRMSAAPPPAATGAAAACGYDPRVVAARSAMDTAGAIADARARLAARVYECYGRAAGRIVVDGDTLDRLTILSRLGREPDAARRKRLFHALDTVWRTMNGDGRLLSSPYRTLLPLSAREWRERGGPPADAARALGIPADSVERWLVRVLERWRDVNADSLVEPWDWWYAAGRASRALSPRIPVSKLRAINDAYHRSLGADPDSLGVRYDLAPRDGKTPVAFTTFGRRARRAAGAWRPTEPWVFATYREGGLDNLNELLHETGHAIHIAAIRTRPAFLDWPDSDALSEALGDLLALEAYEPAWQQRWLGDSVPTSDALRARYAPVMLDVAWALLELRLHAEPGRDPSEEWARITYEYLRVRPYPHLSWWAMRGQLVDAPGYMANYAIGAIVIADLRARMREGRGPLAGDDPGWYAWASGQLYRSGLEAGSKQVVERFLGRAVSPDALLAELERLRATSTTRR